MFFNALDEEASKNLLMKINYFNKNLLEYIEGKMLGYRYYFIYRISKLKSEVILNELQFVKERHIQLNHIEKF